MFGIIGLLLIALIAIQTELVQNWLVGIASKRISRDLGTEVKIKHVSFAFFNRANLEGTLIRDTQKDTLLYAGQLKVRITDWFFTKSNSELKFIGLEDATIKLQRKDSVWNYQFIVDYFSSSSPTKEKKAGMQLSLKKIDFKNVSFIQKDLWAGETLAANFTSLTLDAENINFAKNIIVLNEVNLDRPYFSITNYPALKPAVIKKLLVDTGLSLNPSRMFLQVASLKITNGNFVNTGNDRKPLNYFDADHLNFSKLDANFTNILLNNDTLKINMDLSCKERSGIDLKRLKANFKVTPQIMELANLDLKLNKSKLGNYFAMKFNHFNVDFGEYVTNVLMDAKFSSSKVFSDDIAFFAPSLKTWKKEFDLTGNF
ncbi:MAG: hypothetical protein H7178_01270, partial [Chitinophagaceae bacterium]|nr:hypothetical protein [Chitinophagaceae bacterium]